MKHLNEANFRDHKIDTTKLCNGVTINIKIEMNPEELIPEWTEGIYINEDMILSMGFTPTQECKEWPYTMVYEKDNLSLQYINPWGQGNMDEGWLLKKDGVEVPFRGRRNTLFGTLPNGYILFLDDLKKLIDAK